MVSTINTLLLVKCYRKVKLIDAKKPQAHFLNGKIFVFTASVIRYHNNTNGTLAHIFKFVWLFNNYLEKKTFNYRICVFFINTKLNITCLMTNKYVALFKFKC